MLESAKRVFVLDHDCLSPLGVGKNSILGSLRKNYSAGNTIAGFCPDGLKNQFAAEIKEDLSQFYADESEAIKEAIKYDRKFEMTAACYHLMKKRLHPLFDLVTPARKGVVMGVGLDVSPLEKLDSQLQKYQDSKEGAYLETVYQMNSRSGRLNTLLNPLDLSSIYLAEKLRAGAFQRTTLTACTASTQALVMAYNAIRFDEADVVLAGGTDSIINLLAYMAFGKLGVVASDDQRPVDKRCLPFDKNRSGALVGEAAGLAVLCSDEFLKKNNLKAALELLGYGNTLDGHKITSPEPDGVGMKRAIRMAIDMSGIDPSQVDYIEAHGTGTRANDPVELESVAEFFGKRENNKVMLSSTKDRHGHAIAAAGIQEFSLLCTCMENNLVPANLNLENALEGPVDLVPAVNREYPIKLAMSNNFAFGGVNTVLVVRKNEEI